MARGSTWAFLMYPEVENEEVRDLLVPDPGKLCLWIEEHLTVAAAVSPLHDRDVKDDGTMKKPHYHVLLSFGTLKSYEQVLEMVRPLGVSTVKRVESRTAMTRYLCHLDSPEKALYDVSKVRSVCGFSLDPLYDVSKGRKREIRQDVLRLVMEYNVTSLLELLGLIQSQGLTEEYTDWVVSHSFFLSQILRECAHRDDWCDGL